MKARGNILAINPGSTSTKLGVFSYVQGESAPALKAETVLEHRPEDLGNSIHVLDQLTYRTGLVRQFLSEQALIPHIIMARGAPLAPMEGGIYNIDSRMLEDLKTAKYSEHASNLAALIAYELAEEHQVPAFISDPITTDELCPEARVSGVPEIQRLSRAHALNIKAMARATCHLRGLSIENSRWVVCHMGGGISVVALRNNKLIDVNDALLGMGPFSPQRAGSLPLAGVLKLAYSGNYSHEELKRKFSHQSGLQAYLGTSDLREIESRILSGDEKSRRVFQAMVYQICKEIAAMASVLDFRLDGIILTGGMAHSQMLTSAISERVKALSHVFVQSGENELRALAEAGLRFINGDEASKTYQPEVSL